MFETRNKRVVFVAYGGNAGAVVDNKVYLFLAKTKVHTYYCLVMLNSMIHHFHNGGNILYNMSTSSTSYYRWHYNIQVMEGAGGQIKRLKNLRGGGGSMGANAPPCP